ncbi:MAG: DUF1592 domain-containing protein [Gammaproteobacteria bacterium]
MQRFSPLFLLVSACVIQQAIAADTPAAPSTASTTAASAGHDAAAGSNPNWSMLSEYCTECHNTVDWAGGVAYDAMSPDSLTEDAAVWEAAIRKLRGHLMPPPGNKQPDQARIDNFVGWMEHTLNASTVTPRAGHVPAQRLNRTEYASAVRGLVGVDVKVEDLLPREIDVDGFDNIAAALSVSPAFLDQYISAARFVAKQAVGDSAPKVSVTTYPAPGGAQDAYVDGFPLGTRGGMTFRHNFPADGEYRFSVLDLDVGLYPQAAESRQTLVILVDGKEIARKDVGGPADLALVDKEAATGRKKIMDRFANLPAQVKAGTHEVVVTFIERARSESDEWVEGGFGRLRVARVLDGVAVNGPFNSSGVSMSASRQKIFVCEPKSAAEERPCARRIAETLARRAYRRPVEKADVEALMPFFEQGRKEPGGFDAGIKYVVTAVLSSPDFLYRAIQPAKGAPDTPFHALTDLELASRLSFFLWSEGPDDELIDLAAAGKLHDPAVLDAQVRRMLADNRAAVLVTSFGLKWLNVDDIDAVDPDPRLFPGYTPALRADMAKETELFLRSILLEDRNVTELLTDNHTFLNERLARNYGIPNVRGPQFRKVELTQPYRFGLLGKGAVLLRTSYADRTSPVLRGAWVLERMYGSPPTPPPPNVNTDLSVKPGQKTTTIRARLEVHRAVKSCNQCHGVIDPIGIALENFDTIGQYRTVDRQANAPIDPKTVLSNGVAIDGPVQLREQILRKPEQFVEAFTEKLMMYGLGRELEYNDMPQVRGIVARAKDDDYRFGAIVRGIVSSDAFRLQSQPHDREKIETRKVETKTAAVISEQAGKAAPLQ